MRLTTRLGAHRATGFLPARRDPVDVALRGLTTSANHGVLWFSAAAAGVLVGGRFRRAAIRGTASLAVSSFVANTLIKPLVGRRRPDVDATELARRIVKQPWTSSFPSGHSASAFAFAVGATVEKPVAGVVLLPLAAAVAYSRVHVGVHFATDVAAGAAIGAGIALAGRRLWPVKPHTPAATAPATAPALPGGQGLTIVVNRRSGSSDDAGQALHTLLPTARIVEWDPADDTLEDAVGHGFLALGVAGGDGTVASVAELALRLDVPLAAFPFGTLNHFAGALSMDDARETVAAVEAGRAGAVDVALLNDKLFLNTASIGGYPELVRRRDRLTKRMGKWPAAAIALFRTFRHHSPMRLRVDGRPVLAWTVFVGNGAYRPRGLTSSWRTDLAGRSLDVQYLRADRPLARTRAVVLSLLGLVDKSDVFDALEVQSVRISSDDGPLPTAHDGEVDDPTESMAFALSPKRLVAYH